MREDNHEEGLVYAAGVCRNNGLTYPSAGWAYVYSLSPEGTVSGMLEPSLWDDYA